MSINEKYYLKKSTRNITKENEIIKSSDLRKEN